LINENTPCQNDDDDDDEFMMMYPMMMNHDIVVDCSLYLWKLYRVGTCDDRKECNTAAVIKLTKM
jgi:hypothetical protein